jgi:hypothetical protein
MPSRAPTALASGRVRECVGVLRRPTVRLGGRDHLGAGQIFATVLDGRNAHLTDGVRRALGREPRDFADYAHDTAASGVWDPS